MPPQDPAIWLLRDAKVQSDLRLDTAQQRSLQELLQQIDPRLWLLRDVSGPAPGEADRGPELLKEFHQKLARFLKPNQQTRLQQLVLQARGVHALLQPDFARELQLTASQQQAVQQIVDETAQQLQTRQRSAGEDRESLSQQVTQLRTDEQQRILALITPEQKARWVELRGDLFDLTQIRWTGMYVPELQPADQWINSTPLSLESLRGRVVAVHFWTFGCINCIHNYPAYRAWHQQYASRGLTLIGIHTPETDDEHDIQRLRQKIIDNDLRFPIAVDSQRQNWQAWANRVWPSVYLIDKQGRVRYWWYGELNWEKAEGEKWMRERIEELLAEE